MVLGPENKQNWHYSRLQTRTKAIQTKIVAETLHGGSAEAIDGAGVAHGPCRQRAKAVEHERCLVAAEDLAARELSVSPCVSNNNDKQWVTASCITWSLTVQNQRVVEAAN
jgi:hypothetical protein